MCCPKFKTLLKDTHIPDWAEGLGSGADTAPDPASGSSASWEAVGDSPNTWIPATHMGDWIEFQAPAFCLGQLLRAFGECISKWRSLCCSFK